MKAVTTGNLLQDVTQLRLQEKEARQKAETEVAELKTQRNELLLQVDRGAELRRKAWTKLDSLASELEKLAEDARS